MAKFALPYAASVDSHENKRNAILALDRQNGRLCICHRCVHVERIVKDRVLILEKWERCRAVYIICRHFPHCLHTLVDDVLDEEGQGRSCLA